MQLAIKEGEKGRYTAPPNPWVGCVLIHEGRLVGKGYHLRAGGPHAEIHALKEAGEKACGSTAYVTLEPCVHFGRTPPCVLALCKAGIKKVCIALEDPDEKVKGKGIEYLKKEGIDVHVGICREEATRSLYPYLFQRKHKRPYTILKVASSLDGKICAEDRSSQWITGPQCRRFAHELRHASQAIMIGSGTAIEDQPALTVRDVENIQQQPLRVLLDRRGQTPVQGPLFDTTLAPLVVFTAKDSALWSLKGVDTLEYIDLKNVLQKLAALGVVQLMVEGGGKLIHSFINEGLAQELYLFFGFLALGEKGRSWLPGPWPSSIGAVPKWSMISHHIFDDGFCLRAKL